MLFNILFRKYKSTLGQELPGEFYEIIKTRKGKIYKSRKIIRFQLSDNVKRFVLQKDYADWKNYDIEDVS